MQNLVNFPANFFVDGGLVSIGDLSGGNSVEPGQTFTYSWVVPPEVGAVSIWNIIFCRAIFS